LIHLTYLLSVLEAIIEANGFFLDPFDRRVVQVVEYINDGHTKGFETLGRVTNLLKIEIQFIFSFVVRCIAFELVPFASFLPRRELNGK